MHENGWKSSMMVLVVMLMTLMLAMIGDDVMI
jgi:hypothetical protein